MGGALCEVVCCWLRFTVDPAPQPAKRLREGKKRRRAGKIRLFNWDRWGHVLRRGRNKKYKTAIAFNTCLLVLLLRALKYTNDVRLDDNTFTFKSCQKETRTIIYMYCKHELYDDASVPIFTMLSPDVSAPHVLSAAVFALSPRRDKSAYSVYQDWGPDHLCCVRQQIIILSLLQDLRWCCIQRGVSNIICLSAHTHGVCGVRFLQRHKLQALQGFAPLEPFGFCGFQ